MRLSFLVILYSVVFLGTPAHALAGPAICAEPVWVHEWGVQSFDFQGRRQSVRMPTWFHRASPPPTDASLPPVRHLPADSGTRALPVLHFYTRPANPHPTLPIGIEVGFTAGNASEWYPQVDGRRSRAATQTQAARASHARIGDVRALRRQPAPRDPTYQLFWDRLELTPLPQHTPHPATEAWVRTARTFGAMWANGAQESERFVFYEADTTERSALVVERGPTWQPNRRHLLIRNRSSHPVHDVFLTHVDRTGAFTLFVPTIPAGAYAGYLLEDHPAASGNRQQALRTQLRDRLVDPQLSQVPTDFDPLADCVVGRNPAEPQESTQGHRLFAHEAELLLDAWAAQFFPAHGTTLVYRENTDSLDAMMPLSLFTDMHHYIRLRRLGLAVQSIQLP